MAKSSSKINTDHLARQIEAILESEGISPIELASKSGIAKNTIYSILNREREMAQREVAKKIARATGRKYRIEGNLFFFEDPEAKAVASLSNILDENLALRLQNIFATYSEAEKKRLLDLDLEDILLKFLDMLLSLEPRKRVHKNQQQPSPVERKFISIWNRIDLPAAEKIEATRQLLRNTNLPKLIDTGNHFEIEILNPQGDTHITNRVTTINVGDENIEGWLKRIWFEFPQSDDVRLRAYRDNATPLSIEMRTDYPNVKEFYVNFGEPLKPGETLKYTDHFQAQKMFASDRSHDWGPKRLTLNATVSLQIKMGKKVRKYYSKRETPQGLLDDGAELSAQIGKKEAQIFWRKYFPEQGGMYRLIWEFEE